MPLDGAANEGRHPIPLSVAPRATGTVVHQDAGAGVARRVHTDRLGFAPTEARASVASRPIAAEALSQGATFSAPPRPFNVGRTPDSGIAVGTTGLIVVSYDQLQIFDKWGGGGSSLSLLTLFPGSVGTPEEPRIAFDPANGGHFILTALEQSNPASTTHASYLDIAVSKAAGPSADPRDWSVYRVDALRSVSGSDYYLDFDGLGFDARAIYVTANLLNFSGNALLGAELMTFPKLALESGAGAASASGSGSALPSPLAPANTLPLPGSYSVQPALTYDPAPAEYMIESFDPAGAPTSGVVRLLAVTSPLGAISAGAVTVSVPAYAVYVPNAPQPGASPPIHTGDASILGAVYRGGSLWAAGNVGSVGPASRAVARWYRIGTDGWQGPSSPGTPALIAAGDVNPGPGIATYDPAIAVGPWGGAVLAYDESSSTMAPSVYVLSMPAYGPSSTRLIQAGLAPYSFGRWGDYNGAVADPSLPGVYYVIGEYASDPATWATAWRRIII